MASYPSAVYAPRTKENKTGIVYDPTQKTIGYAEDVVKLDNEVVALETELGLLPKATSASVQERLKGIRSLSDAAADVLVVKGSNVGIGTTGPAGQIALANQIFTSDALKTYTATNGVAGQSIFNSYYTVSALGDVGPYPRMLDIASVGSPDGTNGGGVIRFLTNPITNNSPAVERMRINSNGNVGIGTTIPTAKLDINSDIMRLRTAKTPASAGAAGNAGDICWDANFIYICVATNSWTRVAIAAW
jgi:hypothetical protein